MIDKKNWINRGLPSFCTANFDVLKIILLFTKINNLPVLIESTSNQVNQFGGYTGLYPKSFKKKVDKIRKKLKIKPQKIIFGGDHLGPLPWKNLNESKAMKNAELLIKQYVNSKYDKIHIDTAILCKNQKKLNRLDVVKRCEKLIGKIPSKKLKNIFFVVGTEVPFAGGGDHLKSPITKLDNIEKEYDMYRSLFKKKKLLSDKKFGMVVEPGIAFTNDTITKSSFKDFKNKYNFSKKNNFVYEAHSSDYQKQIDLKKLNKFNYKILKVGPELTYFYSKAIMLMNKLEDHLYKKGNSNIKITISAVMDKNKKYWFSYYNKSKLSNEYLKFNSYLDRIRYYWNNKNIIKSKNTLFKNINKIKDIEYNKIINLNKDNLKTKKKLKLSNVELILFKFLEESLIKYYSACGYKVKNKIR